MWSYAHCRARISPSGRSPAVSPRPGYPLAQDRFRRGEQHMPDRDAPGGEAAEDLVAVLLAQQGHGDHERPAAARRAARPRCRPRAVARSAGPGSRRPRRGVLAAAGRVSAPPMTSGSKSVLFGISSISSPCGGGLPRTERTVDPDDHGSPSSVDPLWLARTTLPRKPQPLTRSRNTGTAGPRPVAGPTRTKPGRGRAAIPATGRKPRCRPCPLVRQASQGVLVGGTGSRWRPSCRPCGGGCPRRPVCSGRQILPGAAAARGPCDGVLRRDDEAGGGGGR